MRPPAPLGVTVAPGNGQAVVTWQPETNDYFPYFPDGYLARTQYGAHTCSASGVATSTCTITGLSNGVTYRVRVSATYTKGISPKQRYGFPSPPLKVSPEP
jgi:hypothetical protein